MSQQTSRKRIAIVGGGPLGLEAALYGRLGGHEVTVFEKGKIANHVRQWQHVSLFSPFKLNHSLPGRKLLQAAGVTLPDDEAYLTGEEYLSEYLQPLAASDVLRPYIISHCEVIAISRKHLLKGEHIGDGQRGNYPFKILTRETGGREKFYHAEVVIDASGTYGNHNWLGEGGIPALGELANEQRIQYGLEDIAGRARTKYLGKTALVVGAGHSAATSIAAFKTLFAKDPSTKVIWITRENRNQPIIRIPGDPLAERDRVAREANELANHPNLRRIKSAWVQAVDYDEATGRFIVEVASAAGSDHLKVDQLIANVGYKPDNRIYRELQVHECYASCGPMKLAAALLSEASSADCLEQTGKGPEVLKNPEPDFYIIGMKSYGKNSNFLLKIGYQQIRDIFQLISGDDKLNLYQESGVSDAQFTSVAAGAH